MNDTQKWQLIALTALLGAVLYVLAPVLTPFAVAALLAYLGDPLADRLQGKHVSRSLAVALVFLFMTLGVLLLVVMLIPMIERQVTRFVERLPAYLDWARGTLLPWVENQFGVDTAGFDGSSFVELLKSHWQQAGGLASTIVGRVSRSGMTVMLWLTNLLLIPVVTFYLLRDWDTLVERMRSLLPRAIEPTFSRLARESDEVLSSFLRGQLLVMLSLGAIYSVGLSLVGIELALLIGMTAGIVSFIPYLGAIVGVAAGLVAAMVQFGDWWHVALVLAVFGIGQTVESFLLTPLLVGDRIGLHPVAVIFAIMAGGHLFGFLGVLLALPVAAVVMVLLRYLHQRYADSSLYGAGAAPPATRDTTAASAPTDAAVNPASDAATNAPSTEPVAIPPSTRLD